MGKIFRFLLTFSLLLVLSLWYTLGVFAQTPTPLPRKSVSPKLITPSFLKSRFMFL